MMANRPGRTQFTEYKIPTSGDDYLGATILRKPLPPTEGPNKIMVICHGLLNTQYSRVVRTLATGLPYHACIFDFRGNGQSSGSTRYGNHFEEVDDLCHVVEYLRNVLHFQVEVIMGHSKGASAALLYSARYADVPYVIDLSGRYDMTKAPMLNFTPQQQEELATQGETVWKHYGLDGDRPYIVRKTDLENLTADRMEPVRCLDFNKVQVLIVHGEDDVVVPVEEGRKYYDVLLNGPVLNGQPDDRLTLKVLPKTSHVFTEPHEQALLLEAVGSWLKPRMC